MFEPQILTEVLRVLEIIVGVMFFYHIIDVMTQARRVEEVVELSYRWRTR